MRTNQYAFVLVLQVVLLLATFTGEAHLYNSWREQVKLSETSLTHQAPGGSIDGLISYLLG